MDDYKLVLNLAKQFRLLIEQYPNKDLLYPTFSNFPKGSCGDASLLLNEFLINHKIDSFEYVVGLKKNKDGNYSHAWLEKNNYVLDITADQFGNYPQVWFGKKRAWHKQFREITRRSAEISRYDTETYKELLEVFYKITS